MDYVRQELLRQRAALARLLLGDDGGQREEDRLSVGLAAEDRAATGAFAEDSGMESARLDTPGAMYVTGGERAPGTVRAGGAGSARGLGSGGGEEAWKGVMTAEDMGGTPESGRQAAAGANAAISGRRWLPRAESRGAEARLEPWLRLETGERTDEKALSRMIQRDARRYDGGFSLY